jgi:subtilisin family serine protease
MKRRTHRFVIAFGSLALIVMFSLLIFSVAKVNDASDTSKCVENGSFKPYVSKPEWVDIDNNGIADSLDQEIADRSRNHAAQEYVNVTVMLKSEPTPYDADAFVSSGGYLTTSAWTQATYGFGGLLPYNKIVDFSRRCSNLLLIEKEAVCNGSIAYAAAQVGARPYVWNTLGFQGDANSSIAILDTGIDDTHPDFSPGFDNQNFSTKIVGWSNQVDSTNTPFDDNGHGSHCAGLAAGNGFSNVNASGYATATYGVNLGAVSYTLTYFMNGMMANKTGTITIKVKWATTGTATLSALPLYFGDNSLNQTSWTSVASVNTPNQNTWYTLTYSVSSTPSSGYDMYHPAMTLTSGSGNLYVVFTMSWPYTPPADGFQPLTGIAPQAKLVGVKVLDSTGSGTTTGLINGINWIIANRVSNHITVASLSLGFSSEVSSVDSAIVNLVNSGITTVVAAGNDGYLANNIYTPGSVDEAITVAAMNQFDNIAGYSSQGGTSRYTGKTAKPDITAPGGSHYAVSLFSVDSNYNDAEGEWSDVQANDSAPMQGTSMAAPVVAGAANIVIQAMGGYIKWNWTRSQALQPKMILLMTATETYPNFRELCDSYYSPTLDRGGKDAHEGFGRLNLDAAVEALVKTYQIGTTVTDTLGMPPTLSDISVLGQRLAWARNIQLVSGFKYNFTLDVPAGADYDLYLYNNTGTTYGEPAIIASSTTASTGGTERFTVVAPYNGTYYLVVKRATETTGSGIFNLTSSGPVAVTLSTPGLVNASTVVHYIQEGNSKNGSITSNTFFDYVDTGTTFQIDNPIYASVTQKYVTSDPTSFPIQWGVNLTVRYTEQFWIQVSSSHDLPSPSQWADRGSSLTVNVSSPADDNGMGTRYRCTGYTLDSNAPITDGSIGYTFENIQSTHNITFNWIVQHRLTVSSNHDSPAPSGTDNWYDTGALIVASVTSPADQIAGTRYRCTGWTGTGSAPSSGTGTPATFVMTEPSSVTWNWITQFQVTFTQTGVGTDYSDSIVTIDGLTYGKSGASFWWDSNSTHNFSFQSPLVVTTDIKRYTWNSTGGLSTLQTDTITVSDSGTVTGNYKTQWYITFSQTGVGSDFSGTVVTIDGANHDRSSVWFWWYDQSIHTFAFQSPLVCAPNAKQYSWNATTGLSTNQGDSSFHVTQSGSITGNYKTLYNVTFAQTNVGSDFTGTVVTIDGSNYSASTFPVQFWLEDGTFHMFAYSSPLVVNATKSYDWVSTTGLSTLQGETLLVTGPGSVTGNYFVHIRYEITFNQTGVNFDSSGTVVRIDGANYSAASLPVTFLFDADSFHTFSFDTQVNSGVDEQYVWISTSGLSSQQSGSITATAPGNITGNYRRKPTLAMNPADRICRKYSETFTVQVNVTNAPSAEEFRFEIHYNATLLDVAGINWNAWASGTYTADEVDGILTGYTSGGPLGGNATLLTITFNATYHHIWKDESTVSGWKNIQIGSIYIQWVNLSYPTGPDLHYERDGLGQINADSEFAYRFSPIQGDVNSNGLVDILDLSTIAAYYDANNLDYDLKGDGVIDIFDLVVVSSNFWYIYVP